MSNLLKLNQTMESILDSRSHLHKLQLNEGLKMVSASGGSAHIMASKIKRAIRDEINWHDYDAIAKELKASHLHINQFKDRINAKIERAQGTNLEVMFNTMNEDGALELVKLMFSPASVMRAKVDRLDAEKRRIAKEESNPSARIDDVFFNEAPDGLDED
jgi:hypothetical protein